MWDQSGMISNRISLKIKLLQIPITWRKISVQIIFVLSIQRDSSSGLIRLLNFVKIFTVSHAGRLWNLWVKVRRNCYLISYLSFSKFSKLTINRNHFMNDTQTKELRELPLIHWTIKWEISSPSKFKTMMNFQFDLRKVSSKNVLIEVR